MNWGQYNLFCAAFNELICTACSPECGRGEILNDSNQSIKSTVSWLATANYSPQLRIREAGGEQVLAGMPVASWLVAVEIKLTV
jgi:hypothetical protein